MAQATKEAPKAISKQEAAKLVQPQDAPLPRTQGQAAMCNTLVQLNPIARYAPKHNTALNNVRSYYTLMQMLNAGPLPIKYLYAQLQYLPTLQQEAPHGRFITYMLRQKPPVLIPAQEGTVCASTAGKAHLTAMQEPPA